VDAIAMPRRTGAIPLIATTVDGRPIKRTLSVAAVCVSNEDYSPVGINR
jgi:hypothetical protein